MRKIFVSMVLLALLEAAAAHTASPKTPTPEPVPQYRVEPAWPKPLPNHWTLGAVCGVAVDRHQNIWIVHRPPNPVPPVLEFSPDGSLLAAWGGPGPGYNWPELVHGVYVDLNDHVWVGGAGAKDNQILKFTAQGKFLLQIGHPGQNRGSNDTENLGGPAGIAVDDPANEVYVADGYINHRVIVFDATTGAYKRHWGAYGKRPDDSYYMRLGIQPGVHPNNLNRTPPSPTPPPQFDLVHSLRLSKDGFVYVCDRTNNRLQVFRRDGRFVREAFVANDVRASGSTSDIGFSADPGQRFVIVLDSTKDVVYVLDRRSLKILGSFGKSGTRPGEFHTVHNMAVNAKGDLFIGDVGGARVQKFVQTGTGKSE
jgi:DNA-binding beta-propeller fold protein YncE